MNEHELIERFNRDVDRLLNHETLPDSADQTSVEYAEMVALAEKLWASDFSYQSQVRQPLRLSHPPAKPR